MALSPDAFYLENLPTALQQGDIAVDVPLLLLPPLESLVLVRSAHHRLPLDHLEPGDAVLVDEQGLTDRFERGTEYAAVSVHRAHAMLVTPTCDLQANEVWAVWPLRPIADSGLDEGNLSAGKFTNLFRLPDHEHFDGAFIDLTDIRSVSPQHFMLKNRIASLTRDGQDEIFQRFHRSMGRIWGYRDDEVVDALGKYETGKFRCGQCNLYDIEVPVVDLKPGMKAPECPNCKKIKRRPQWYPLTQHRKQ